MKFVDIHTHSAPDSKSIQIKDLSGKPVESFNGASYFSLGIHPWQVHDCNIENEIQKIENKLEDPLLLAIGECGLDMVCNSDFSLQMDVFKRQIALSEAHRKPLILHVVKSFNELILLRQKAKYKQPWIVHGFNGSSQLAKQLIELGMFISFGYQLKNPISKGSLSIQSIPFEHFFLETDNSGISIEDIYALAAQRLNRNTTQLQSQLYQNFQTLFLGKCI